VIFNISISVLIKLLALWYSFEDILNSPSPFPSPTRGEDIPPLLIPLPQGERIHS